MKSKSVLKREAVQKGEPMPQEAIVSKSHFSDMLCQLLKEMRTESVEYLWDYADDIGIRDEQACQFMVSRLEDFFNRKIYEIKRQA